MSCQTVTNIYEASSILLSNPHLNIRGDGGLENILEATPAGVASHTSAEILHTLPFFQVHSSEENLTFPYSV